MVKSLSDVKSLVFTKKTTNDAIFSFLKEEGIKTNSLNELRKEVYSNFDCNPDGWIIYVANRFKNKMVDLIKKEYVSAYKEGKLNFGNGSFAEAILFMDVDSGMICEFLDPECGSEFFDDLVETMTETTEAEGAEENDLMCFDFCHMQANMDRLEDFDNRKDFIAILQRNGINF